MAPALYALHNTTRLDGRVVVVTGANTGIGKETARDLCRRGAKVIILCRNEEKATAAVEEIIQDTKGIIEFQKLDLSSQQSVRDCASHLNESLEKIDILVNNAGVICPLTRTEEGYEMQFATNHLGHFLLTELLLPLLKKSAATGFNPRIVIVSSLSYKFASIKWDDINSEISYSIIKANIQSKLANFLHARELARRFKEENIGISVYALSPGPGAVITESDQYLPWLIRKLRKVLAKTPEQAAQTNLYCCLEESIVNHSGRLYSGCKEVRVRSTSSMEEDQKRLWDLSEKMVGIKKD